MNTVANDLNREGIVRYIRLVMVPTISSVNIMIKKGISYRICETIFFIYVCQELGFLYLH